MSNCLNSFVFRRFVQDPFVETFYHYLQYKQTSTWGGRKIAHLCQAVIYAIPVIGAIILIAVKCLKPVSSAVGLDIRGYPYGVKERIETMMQEGKVEDAWNLFKTTRKNYPNILPAEPLFLAIMNKRIASQESQIKMEPEFLRDCALRYESVRALCLKEPKLWAVFDLYPEYVADIAKKSSAFAFEVITSEKGRVFKDDTYRMEMMRSSSEEFKRRSERGMITLEQMKQFGYFMFLYYWVISQDDFVLLNTMSKSLMKHPQCEGLMPIMDLVMGKMMLQKNTDYMKAFGSDQWNYVDIFVLGRQEFQQGEIGQRLVALKVDENIRHGIAFLECIPTTAPHYDQVRFALGHFWLDQEEYATAGQCFLQAGLLKTADPNIRQEAFLLAALALFVKSTDGQFVPRGEQKKDTEEKKRLSADECKAMVANEQEFLTRLRANNMLT